MIQPPGNRLLRLFVLLVMPLICQVIHQKEFMHVISAKKAGIPKIQTIKVCRDMFQALPPIPETLAVLSVLMDTLLPDEV
jgi:hypothetical protein